MKRIDHFGFYCYNTTYLSHLMCEKYYGLCEEWLSLLSTLFKCAVPQILRYLSSTTEYIISIIIMPHSIKHTHTASLNSFSGYTAHYGFSVCRQYSIIHPGGENCSGLTGTMLFLVDQLFPDIRLNVSSETVVINVCESNSHTMSDHTDQILNISPCIRNVFLIITSLFYSLTDSYSTFFCWIRCAFVII